MVGLAMFTLYTTPLSANGRKVLAVCKHLGLEPDTKLVNVYRGEGRRPEYLAIHALGKIPVLVDGELVLSESNAIVQYVSEAYGDGRLWSREPKRRADIARWMFWESSQWQPALARILAPFVTQELGLLGSTPDVSVDWSDASFVDQARFLDAHLQGRAFIAGDEVTLADFCVAAMLMYVHHAGFPFEAHGRIHEWYERVERLEAWTGTAVPPWRY
jgi:glutathione S-transferase